MYTVTVESATASIRLVAGTDVMRVSFCNADGSDTELRLTPCDVVDIDKYCSSQTLREAAIEAEGYAEGNVMIASRQLNKAIERTDGGYIRCALRRERAFDLVIAASNRLQAARRLTACIEGAIEAVDVVNLNATAIDVLRYLMLED